LGGLTISLGGICRHSTDWDPAYDLWHVFRPALGAITGSIACLLLGVLITFAADNQSSPAGDPNEPNLPAVVYEAAAFVFGFAESAFRELVKSLTNVFVRPGQQNPKR